MTARDPQIAEAADMLDDAIIYVARAAGLLQGSIAEEADREIYNLMALLVGVHGRLSYVSSELHKRWSPCNATRQNDPDGSGCSLPRGHDGPHLADDGHEWGDELSELH